MPTYSAAVLTGAGSATLPMCALVGDGTHRVTIREIGIFNTTTTAVDVIMCRVSTPGTPGSSATAACESDQAGVTATAVLKGTYTSTAPTTVIAGRRAQLAGAVGSAVIWTFPNGLTIPTTANAAVGIISTGTGQACDVYMVWEES